MLAKSISKLKYFKKISINVLRLSRFCECIGSKGTAASLIVWVLGEKKRHNRTKLRTKMILGTDNGIHKLIHSAIIVLVSYGAGVVMCGIPGKNGTKNTREFAVRVVERRVRV